jgi:hypothetical protein
MGFEKGVVICYCAFSKYKFLNNNKRGNFYGE